MANQIPDFDSMTREELGDFWLAYRGNSAKKAAALVGFSGPGCVHAAQVLAAYAINASCARKLRLEGKIAHAMTYEHAMELGYAQLPESCRW